MSNAPSPVPGPAGADQGKRGGLWLGLIIAALLALVIGIGVPMVKRSRPHPQSSPTVVDTAPEATGYVSSLTVSEATMDPNTRRIKGIVANGGGRTMEGVVVTYHVRKGIEEAGQVSAQVGSLGPHQSAKFETDAMAPNATEFVIRDIQGTPR